MNRIGSGPSGWFRDVNRGVSRVRTFDRPEVHSARRSLRARQQLCVVTKGVLVAEHIDDTLKGALVETM
jgi:hypothetical protein